MRLAAAAALALTLASSAAAAVLRVCDDVQPPASLNPYQIFSEKALTVIQQVLEGLVRFDAEGRIQPALAESWERVDPNTMRFHLRKGVTFHNGEELDAESVKFSLEKYAASETKYPAAGFVTVSKVKIIDPRTVDVVTSSPDGLLLNRLSLFGHIVPVKYYKEAGDDGFAKKPIGTGPFRFESLETRELVLSANPKYWEPGLPRVEGLTFRFLPANEQVDALLDGELDILTTLPGTRTLNVQRSTTSYVLKHPTFYTVVGNFNVNRKPLSSKKVREAINLAIDRSALVRYDLLGNGAPAGTISLPGEFGHNEDLKAYPYDPKAARRLLREEGYPSGFSLKVLLKVNAARTGQIIARQLADVGIRLEFTHMTDAQIFELMSDRTPWDILIADCPDPLLHSFFIRYIFLGGKSPFSLSSVPEIDERLERLVATLDPQKQLEVSRELDSYIYSQYLAIPTYRTIRTYGLKKGVRFTPYISGMPYFRDTAMNAKTDAQKE